MRFCRFLPFLLSLFVSAAGADAGLPVGKVKRYEGSVNLQRAGLTLPVQVGSPVQVGDRVRTGVDGAVGITLADDTLLTAGPNSTLLINDFRFDPTTREGGMLTTLLKGTLSVVTGLLARQTPENVRFTTPNVVLGIRGTEFIIEARGADE
ncbi:FecR domain-containing protein [Accumulibacter sp.]|uniref:FecR family protein n=1 Tax=Accumulibacter sp. TaxID=2053492 RepID=UPI001AC1F626|nr:FecR domain-containing protein [Accumulibacter sp.]MBN8452481.1 FecR domain-containing protein [Accumulibacter sp.]MBO3704828.1 FecR domain-containing protein [Candidatus Accumulibacter conexus]